MRKLRPLLLILAIAPICGLLLAGCSATPDPWPEKPGPRVLASFAPLYSFAKNVAGDDASVLCVTAETGPHGFDPTPRDAVAVRRADLFVINGLDLDDGIAKKMTRGARNSGVRIVRASKGIPDSQLREGTCNCGHEHGQNDDPDPDHKHYDPHVWLGIPEAILMVGTIRDELKAFDPDHAAGYDKRAAEYVEKLNKLHAEGLALLKDKKERKLLAFHDSLHYFAKSFDLKIVDSIAAPGTMPDSQTILDLIKTCRDNQARHIAVEPEYGTNSVAKKIMQELKNRDMDAEFVMVDPLETAPVSELDAGYYERKMRENLRRLADKLK